MMKYLLTFLLSGVCFVAARGESALQTEGEDVLLRLLSEGIPDTWTITWVGERKIGTIEISRKEPVIGHLMIPCSPEPGAPEKIWPKVLLSPRPFVSREEFSRLSNENAKGRRLEAELRAKLSAIPTMKSGKPTPGAPNYLPRDEQERRLVKEVSAAIANIKYHELPGFYYGSTAYDVQQHPLWPMDPPAAGEEFESVLRTVRTVLHEYNRREHQPITSPDAESRR